jgi:hypothetical protein
MAAIAKMDPSPEQIMTKTGVKISCEIDTYIMNERTLGREPISYRLPWAEYICFTDYLTSRLRPICFSNDLNGLPEFVLYRGIRLMPY